VIGILAAENYRSLRNLVVELGRLTVVTGANGTGKSSLYRALRLPAGIAWTGRHGNGPRDDLDQATVVQGRRGRVALCSTSC
jgi:AAA15 family ATPase/GTPase